ncbi:MAG: DUF222 domain-containing protein [Pauljensenia sp.]
MDATGGPGAGAAQGELLTALRHLEQVARDGVVPEELGDDELLVLLADAEAVGRLADGLRVLGAGVVAERSRPSLGEERLSARRGCRTPAELVERTTRVSGATARQRIRAAAPVQMAAALSGELLPARFPLVRPGLGTGVLSLDAAGTIVQSLGSALDHGAAHADVSAAEDALVSAATGWDGADRDAAGPECSPPTLTADDIAVMANAWGLALDPDGSLPDESSGLRRRGLTLGRERGGTVPLRGELLPDVAAQLQRLFDAYLNPRVDADPHPDPDNVGVAPAQSPMEDATEDGPPEHRSPTQRRHDALAGVLTIAASHDQTPRLGGTAPTLVVTASIDQLSDPSGVAFLQGAGDPTQSAVGVHVAQHTGCSGAVQKVLLGTDGSILGLTTPQRVFTPHQRRAIALRDGECVIPGCHVPSTWCEVHHVHEHAEGGPTDTSNGVLLCWYHHRSLDRSGWKIEMRRGLPWVRPPTWIDPFVRWRPARPAADVHRRVIRAPARSRDGTNRRAPATRATRDNRTNVERLLLHDQDTGPPAPV